MAHTYRQYWSYNTNHPQKWVPAWPLRKLYSVYRTKLYTQDGNKVIVPDFAWSSFILSFLFKDILQQLGDLRHCYIDYLLDENREV